MNVDDGDNYQTLVRFNPTEQDVERAKILAAEKLAYGVVKAVDVVIECLHDEDPQVRLRAADLMMSRTLPKVAAKHVNVESDVIESADTAALRESILAQVKKNEIIDI